MKYLFLILVTVACAKQNANETSTSIYPLRDSMPWQSTSPWWATDLNPIGPQIQIIHFVVAYDVECESAAHVVNGNITVSFSTQITGNNGMGPWPGCSYFDGNYTYSVSNNQLTLCPQSGSCVTFQ